MGTVWEEAYTHKGNLITLECVADATSIASTKKRLFIQNMGAINYTKLLFLEEMA